MKNPGRIGLRHPCDNELTHPGNNIHITFYDPDSDLDGLPDWWEYAYLGGISFDGSDDPDGDGLVNSNEMAYLTDPQDADTDEDGLGDGWMVTNGFSPLQISYEHLAGCWRFDETHGVVASDSSENGNVATVDGAVWSSGWLNGGLVFDGSNDSVTVANSTGKRYQCTNSLKCSVRNSYIAGLDPNDSQSCFHIIKPSEAVGFGNGFVVNWNSVSGRVYSIYGTLNLMSGFQCLESNIPWTRNSFTNQAGDRRNFFKIDVRLAK